MSSCLWLTMWLLSFIQDVKILVPMIIAYAIVSSTASCFDLDSDYRKIFTHVMRIAISLVFIYSAYPDKHIQAIMFDEGMNSAKFLDLSKESLGKISEIKAKVFVLDKK